jgi:hypothetical protein
MPLHENPEQWLELFRSMGTPAQIRRRVELFDEIVRERRSEDFKARERAIDALLEEAKGRQWFIRFTTKAATYAAGVATAFLGLVAVMAWLRDYILSLK